MYANKARLENMVDSTQRAMWGSQLLPWNRHFHWIPFGTSKKSKSFFQKNVIFKTAPNYATYQQIYPYVSILYTSEFVFRNAQTRSLAVLLVLSVQKTGEVGVRDEKQERPADGLAGRTDHEVFVTMSGTFCFLTNFEVECYDGICTVYNDIVWQHYQVMFILPWMVYMGRRILGCSVQMMYSTRMGMSSSSPHSCPHVPSV